MKFLFAPLPLLFSVSVAAPQCPADSLVPYTLGNAASNDEVTIEAKTSKVSQKMAVFTGNVVAKRGRELFHSNRVSYNRETGELKTPESMIYGTPEFVVHAQKSHYSLHTELGSFYDLEYLLTKDGVNGEAKQIDIDRKASVEKMREAIYSTCPRADRSWSIKADRVALDHKEGTGESWDTTFRLGNTPILYLPYFSFPIDDRRKTGALLPKINLSEGRGIDVTQPYYLNLAANQDATLYPRLMSKRGLMLGGEYRYLLPKLSGRVSGAYLPNDQKATRDRWSFSSFHQYQPNEHFLLSGHYRRISDKAFIEEFEDTLDLSNINFLESYLNAKYQVTPHYRVFGDVKHYQVSNSLYSNKDKPYHVLPRLSGKGSWYFGNGVVLKSDTEITNFDKKDWVSGWRFDHSLAVSYPIERTYGFIRPSAIYRASHYQLRGGATDAENTPSRFVPTFAIDGGLFFDRQMTWFGSRATQSLEPRLFYLNTPYRDQASLPDFDTSLVDSSYDAMFLMNRFNGKDRIGDANQLTTAISSTITDNESGRELAKLAVGQIQYFGDRRVSLLDTIANESRSNVIAEGHIQVNDQLRIRGLTHYDTDKSDIQKSLFGVTYSLDADKSINLSQLYDRENYKQIDVSGVWRINDKWRTFWRWNYSLQYNRSIDTFAGLEYADCCWGVRLIGRQKRDSLTADQDPETTVYLEFALKGLGNLGSDTTSALREIIPNYQSISYEKPQ